MIVRKTLKPTEYAPWRQIAPLGVMAAAIVMVVSGEMSIIAICFGKLPTVADIVLTHVPAFQGLTLALALIPFLTLVALLAALLIVRLLVPHEHIH